MAALLPDRLRQIVRKMIDGFDENELLLFASAISFQVLTSLVPLLLFALGALGFLGLTEVWTQDVRPTVQQSVSPEGLKVIDDTVRQVLGSAQLFWVTAGAALAAWQLSGAVRAAMSALDRVYGDEDDRGFWPRYLRSVLIAVTLAILTFLAVAVVMLVPLVDGDPGPALGALFFVARWLLAAALLWAAVGILVHEGPCQEQPLGWTSRGALTIVGAWVLMSGGFGLYLSQFASYGSIYGALASVVILMGYLYASTAVFLGAVQLDVILRELSEAEA